MSARSISGETLALRDVGGNLVDWPYRWLSGLLNLGLRLNPPNRLLDRLLNHAALLLCLRRLLLNAETKQLFGVAAVRRGARAPLGGGHGTNGALRCLRSGHAGVHALRLSARNQRRANFLNRGFGDKLGVPVADGIKRRQIEVAENGRGNSTALFFITQGAWRVETDVHRHNPGLLRNPQTKRR